MSESVRSSKPSELAQIFERRASRLRWEAYGFLVLVIICLVFGGSVVYYAPEITAKDVSQGLDQRAAAVSAEIERRSAKEQDLGLEIQKASKGCDEDYKHLFEPSPPNSASRPDDGGFHPPPGLTDRYLSSSDVASKILQFLDSKEVEGLVNIGMRIRPSPCYPGEISLILTREGWTNFARQISAERLTVDISKLNDLKQRLGEERRQIQVLTDVSHAIYQRQISEKATGDLSPAESVHAEHQQELLRLIQTTITRFGTLAVVSFLVTILVSLYRYNIRLSSFYEARADLARLQGSSLKALDFKIFAESLTPRLDFGKTPNTPISSAIELIRAVRGLEKPSSE